MKENTNMPNQNPNQSQPSGPANKPASSQPGADKGSTTSTTGRESQYQGDRSSSADQQRSK